MTAIRLCAIALCLLAPPARADPPGLITTQAEARRRLPNTVVDAVVTIEVHGRDLRTTADLLARRSQSLLDHLRSATTDRLRTEHTAFEPERQEVRGQPDRIKGFTGRVVVTFRTTPDRLPALLSSSLEHGATGVQSSGSQPREQEIVAARQELAAEATKAALEEARAIAVAADQRPAGIERIEVGPQRSPESGEPSLARLLQAPRPIVPMATEAGDKEIAVLVVVTIRLAPPT